MILQALNEYYERKDALGEIAPVGFEEKQIPYLVIIDSQGNFKDFKDTYEKEGDRRTAKSWVVPMSEARSGSASWKTAFLLWDHYGYVLGAPKGDSDKERRKRHDLILEITSDAPEIGEWKESEKLLSLVSTADLESLCLLLDSEKVSKAVKDLKKSLGDLLKSIEDSQKQLGSFQRVLKNLYEKHPEPEIGAILQFYEKGEHNKIFETPSWKECSAQNGVNMTFKMEGEAEPVLRKSYVIEYQKERALSFEGESPKGICLISGRNDFLAALHGSTPIPGGQATGKLVSFQRNSGYDSYGKEQSFNAPVGNHAQMAYTTALNTLIKSSSNKILLGDTTMVFWAEKKTSFEADFPMMLIKPKDHPDDAGAVKQAIESITTGKYSAENDNRFYVLGLAPNAARVAVRYWINGPVSMISENIKIHFEDLDIIEDKETHEFFALSSLLSHTALEFKLSNVAPNLPGQVSESILKGLPYPQHLQQAAIRRIRAEQKVTRARAAILKACINRFNRFHKKNKEVLQVSLDKMNRSPAYLLGRLLAVLEKIQWKALGIETIRERYYGAFSTSPVTVYPQLMKLKNHHLAKMSTGQYFYENLIGEIIDGLDGEGIIPRQLNLEDQGRFAVGYYHQRQDLKYKKEESDTMEDKNE